MEGLQINRPIRTLQKTLQFECRKNGLSNNGVTKQDVEQRFYLDYKKWVIFNDVTKNSRRELGEILLLQTHTLRISTIKSFASYYYLFLGHFSLFYFLAVENFKSKI